ncbi:MAG: bifunctional 3-phosphoshikimate 1-carboxyvinyltransferase/cytidylate kinase, partial [Rhodoferax sp.]|nr:bifunctional 3-phosphoshikimate 1-carboxyvinyltransferase/cytidylate kinase [Rhodoferax sp.]
MFATKFLDIPPLVSAGGQVLLPGSKSISNRLLLLSALSVGSTTLHDLLDSDDTRVMLDALRQLGCSVASEGSSVTIEGLGGVLSNQRAVLFMGNAGTAMRPLTAALAVLGGDFELRGVPRMHERPIGDLVDALRQLGCRINYLGQDGFPPLHIGQAALTLDRPIQVRGDVSSQFLTALLMALPLVAKRDIVIEVQGELISRPYIEITLKLLARFGVQVGREDWRRFVIPAGCQLRSPGVMYVEADASSASYFIALGAIAPPGGQDLRIDGVGAESIQGDIRFIDAARLMGA